MDLNSSQVVVSGRIGSIDLNQNILFILNDEATKAHFLTLGGLTALGDEIHTMITYHMAFQINITVEFEPGTELKLIEGDLENFSKSMVYNPPPAHQILGINFVKNYEDVTKHLEELRQAQTL